MLLNRDNIAEVTITTALPAGTVRLFPTFDSPHGIIPWTTSHKIYMLETFCHTVDARCRLLNQALNFQYLIDRRGLELEMLVLLSRRTVVLMSFSILLCHENTPSTHLMESLIISSGSIEGGKIIGSPLMLKAMVVSFRLLVWNARPAVFPPLI